MEVVARRHAVACVGLTGLQVASILADLLIREWRPPLAIGWGGAVQLIALSRIVPDALIYVAVLGTGSALYYYGSFRERELLASRLETQLAESRLAVLRLQLNPHFLFNTLNTVASQIRVRREDGALRMLDRLGELLRRALNPAQQTETVLAEELRFLSCYAEIEKERFGDRLEILVSVDPEVLAARRPLKKSPFPLAASGEGR